MRIVVRTRPHIATTQCGSLPKKLDFSSKLTRSASSSEYATKRLKHAQQVGSSSSVRPDTRRAYEHSSPEATFARHAFRAILRECTYLPDAVAAQYIKEHTLFRFRVNGYKAWKDRELFEEQNEARRKEARHTISTLKRANKGVRTCLLKVLHVTYGRIGKRRHELLRPLLSIRDAQEAQAATVDLSSTASEEDSASIRKREEMRIEEPVTEFVPFTPTTPLDLTPQLRALLQSQIRVRPPSTIRRSNPRRIEPIIPELNTWLRPTPQSVIRNARKKHYAYLLDHVQPPLPTEEWEQLRGLASGKVYPDLPPRRRTQASVSSVENHTAKGRDESALELVARYGKVPRKAFGNRSTHRITPRMMQRLYAEVFSQCPVMEWDSAREEWKVTWGFQALFVDSVAPDAVDEKP